MNDLIVYKFNTEKYLLVIVLPILKKIGWISGNNDMKATLTNVSMDYCLFAIQGPKALDVLQSITKVDLKVSNFITFVRAL